MNKINHRKKLIIIKRLRIRKNPLLQFLAISWKKIHMSKERRDSRKKQNRLNKKMKNSKILDFKLFKLLIMMWTRNLQKTRGLREQKGLTVWLDCMWQGAQILKWKYKLKIKMVLKLQDKQMILNCKLKLSGIKTIQSWTRIIQTKVIIHRQCKVCKTMLIQNQTAKQLESIMKISLTQSISSLQFPRVLLTLKIKEHNHKLLSQQIKIDLEQLKLKPM